MDYVNQVKKDSIKEFGSTLSQEKYIKIAEQGLWESEEILINRYFKSNAIILDIGCGSGRTTIELSKKGYKVIGVDITPEMIATAQKITSSKKINIDYRVGDATNLKFSGNHFDGAIFANNGWVQIPGKENRQRALNEIYRVLRPDSYLIFTAHQRYYSGHHLFFWIVKWIKFYVLRSLGFRIQEIEFGDLFFRRNYQNKKIKQRQFIHMTSQKEVEEQIKNTGFKLEMKKSLGQISKNDADSLKGSLSNNDNPYKSPIFYICKK